MSAIQKVLILGGGFAGLEVARGLAGAPVEITVIDRQNYHLFQPLLYQVATAGLSPADIASPIRSVLSGQQNVSVLLARVANVDLARKLVTTDQGEAPFDTLVVATGARHAYFGHDEWEPFAPGLKKIDDATDIRRRILLAFERAESEPDLVVQTELLTFVVVGAGPTGVEMAGAIAELSRRSLSRDFKRIDPRMARIVLVEAGPRVLPSFDPALSAKAERALTDIGVEVRTGTAVTACDRRGVAFGAERLPSRTVVWAAGVRASPAAKWLDAEADPSGRVIVGPDLRLPGRDDVFVIGDTAHVAGPDGRPYPGVAPVAKQQGRQVAHQIRYGLSRPFRYRDFGSMATIGRKRAVAQLGPLRLSGFPAWLLWSVAHVYFLIGFRNRLVVALTWAWAYITWQRGTRLITGGSRPASERDLSTAQGVRRGRAA
ncbi:FAD-dependent oxidoreductase [Alsobacter soli]|uniref:NADH:ubiquinone reductase (non-electrogenic) n=1 Tax=Alsobacter soli TaxID=2109933 RepID=A0A2T1HWJ4_9HYPH|nr:NAD(P)/FAD-dependent oxidoreductase [Alsobacter soli]PSC06067.1 FAD-dependent oxidoreductase [Alsobacter soli]